MAAAVWFFREVDNVGKEQPGTHASSSDGRTVGLRVSWLYLAD